MVFEHRSYREFLKNVLVERKNQNPKYSLRAFAGGLGFSSSQLSEALSGKANFSPASLRRIARKLKLTSRESEYLLALGEFESAHDPELRDQTLTKLKRLSPRKTEFSDLTIDRFKQISDWYHSAILELVNINDFNLNAKQVAQKIGITQTEAELAIARLERLGLIEKLTEGRYRRCELALQIKSEEKSAAMRKLYRQMFEKASTALETQTPDGRWSGYETFPVAREALPEIRRACEDFFDEVLRISNQYENKTDVYHLLTHVFNLTEDRKK